MESIAYNRGGTSGRIFCFFASFYLHFFILKPPASISKYIEKFSLILAKCRKSLFLLTNVSPMTTQRKISKINKKNLCYFK